MQQSDSIISDSVVSAVMADTTIVEQTNTYLSPFEAETFFPSAPLLYTERLGQLPGVAGVPVPYTMSSDDILVCFILVCFIATTLVFTHSGQTFFYHLKNFFYISRSEHSSADAPSRGGLLILNLQTSLLLGFAWYFYTTHCVTDTYLLDSPYAVMAVYFAVFVVFFLSKIVVYWITNVVFFNSKKSKQMVWTLSFVAALEGLAFFPAVILHIFLDLSMQNIIYYFVFVLILAKLMTFYKCWVIFFRQTSVFLQIILYFCALEIIPLLILGGVLVTITNELKVTF